VRAAVPRIRAVRPLHRAGKLPGGRLDLGATEAGIEHQGLGVTGDVHTAVHVGFHVVVKEVRPVVSGDRDRSRPVGGAEAGRASRAVRIAERARSRASSRNRKNAGPKRGDPPQGRNRKFRDP
jgi:hypothetical protein